MEDESATDTSSFLTETASYLPPSMLSKRLSLDVFISFRGEDTRHAIAVPLYTALRSNGKRAFIDSVEMHRGDEIQPSLDNAIVDSALAVVVISPRYADSRWCLDELTRMFDCRKRILPVFYRVNPSDVRKQRGELGEGFRKLLGRSPGFSEERVKRWRKALEDLAGLSGYTCNESSEEPELIQMIVQQVVDEFKNSPEYVAKLAVGLGFRVNNVLERLNLHSGGVCFLGIHGTPGIGKTTLAKAVFNEIVAKFSNRCFISNVRESLAGQGGLLSILKKLVQDLSLRNVAIEDEDEVRRLLKSVLREKSVLIVLDDVSDSHQLESLGIDDRKMFEDGSRVIVTSRNIKAIDKITNGNELYEAERLDDLESLELFSIHALGRREPTEEFKEVSKEIVSLTGGLPLALEVFGSSLVKRTKREWEDSVIKLRQIRPPHLQDVLKLSYDGLDEQEKTIFLDISCLLLQTNMNKEEVVDVLEGCDLNAEIGIGNIVMKSLLKIMEDDRLWMHDQVRDMGRQIVIEQSLPDLGKRSRLWNFSDISSVLQCSQVADAIRGVIVDVKKPPDFNKSMLSWIDYQKHPNIITTTKYMKEKLKECMYGEQEEDGFTILSSESFKKMESLKLLKINYVKVHGDFKYMPDELRWLGWRGCPCKTVPANLPQEIRVLDLSESKIENFGSSGWFSFGISKVAQNLVVMNLSRCAKLTVLPDMSGYPHLKKLILELCVGLTKIHDSVGNMSSLVHLNLSRCSNLAGFPRDVTGMKGLRELILSDCRKLNRLPNDVRSMKSLIKLLADRTSITQLPEYLFHLTQLKVLNLRGCNDLKTLPLWLGKLTSLEELYLDSTGVVELPDTLGLLGKLKKLSVMHCTSLTALPDSIGSLRSLVGLYLNASSIEQLPASIGSLCFLRTLAMGSCLSISTFPVSMKGLASLVELELDMTPIIELPGHLCSLQFIKKLSLMNCTSLQRLPKSLGSMSSLTVLVIVGAPIIELPESIGELGNLISLNLNKCKQLCTLPDKIGNLMSLKEFTMQETGVTSLPETFGLLQNLRVLNMKKPLPLEMGGGEFSIFPAYFGKFYSLEELDVRACRFSGQIHEDFGSLSKLEILDFSYNDFDSLPFSMEGMCVLKKLSLRHCEKLTALPQLPSTLVELNAADCYALESIRDLSNLEKLQELQLANCKKIKDVPGLECLKSLRRLYMGGCNASASIARTRLSKAALKNLNNLSFPGSKIPDWFTQNVVNFEAHGNLLIKSVLIGVIVSVDYEKLDEIRSQLPSIIDIQARILRDGERIFATVLLLYGIPTSQKDQLYLCRFKHYHPLVSMLREGDMIEVGWRTGPATGIDLKMWGIHLVFENDDDYDSDEDSMSLPEDQQSVSHRLVRFFHPF